jgi:hypothetical protein
MESDWSKEVLEAFASIIEAAVETVSAKAKDNLCAMSREDFLELIGAYMRRMLPVLVKSASVTTSMFPALSMTTGDRFTLRIGKSHRRRDPVLQWAVGLGVYTNRVRIPGGVICSRKGKELLSIEVMDGTRSPLNIHTCGNVGIGTIAPTAKLYVVSRAVSNTVQPVLASQWSCSQISHTVLGVSNNSGRTP